MVNNFFLSKIMIQLIWEYAGKRVVDDNRKRELIFLKRLENKEKGGGYKVELPLVPLAPRGHPTVCPRVELRT
jgi:hypothetical protein